MQGGRFSVRMVAFAFVAAVGFIALAWRSGAEVGAIDAPRPPSPTAEAAPADWVHDMAPLRCTSGPDVATYVPRDSASYQANPVNADKRCCTPIQHDIDKGLTMYHLLVRFACSVHARGGNRSSTTAGVVERIRLLQVGANTGDNDNDHLFRFLRQRRWAEAVLMEPVPWLFDKLSTAYQHLGREVTLVNAALSKADGDMPFFAPLKDAPGWVKQMGGFSITPRNMNVLRRKRLTHLIRETTVKTMTMRSVLQQRGWGGQLPHVVVIDTEGFDAQVMEMLLNEVGTARAIPIIQYEWKHLQPAVNDALVARLVSLGYCSLKVHYDVLAYHAATMEGLWPESCAASFLLPT